MTTARSDALRTLKLQWSPVAIAFMATPPGLLPRVNQSLPAGCAYWKHASEGHSFYTTPEDHFNCPVGAFTHGVTLPETQKLELEGLISTMIKLEYLQGDEVAGIPHRHEPLKVAVYAPLDDATFKPDVVIVRGNVRQMMLISEAARSAGVFSGADIMGRPACAMIAHVAETESAVASFACIGNRVYTNLADDELYITVPGAALSKVLERLEVILGANAQLETYHREKNESAKRIT
jgi:uncharacterized protein (DUF169 family)